jgi:energy-coupling factor transporter transmembrane protein EcfT
MAVPVLRYIHGDGCLHRRHPLVKLAILILLYAALFLLGGWYVPAGIGAALFGAHACVKGGPSRYLGLAKRFIIFLFFIILAHLFLMRGAGSLSSRVISGFVQGMRVFDLLVATSLFLAVTDPVDLSDSLLDLFHPLDRNGQRLAAVSLMLMVVFSFLPLAAEEAGRLRTAVGARCGFGGGLLQRSRNAVALLAALFVGILRRAEELEISLTARRYAMERAHRVFGARPDAWDVVLLLLSLFIFAAGVYAQL